MTWPPCGDAACSIAEPTAARLRAVHGVTLPAGSRWWRGSTHPTDTLAPPGSGDTRFAPLPGTSHGYFGATRTVSLLESALHSAAGPDPTIYLAELAPFTVAEVELTADVRLFDLRDAELDRLGLPRSALVDSTAHHYRCTRTWSARLQFRRPGGYHMGGILWNSRQADLHARAHPGGLLADVLRHGPVEVGVIWHPAGPVAPFVTTGAVEPLVVGGQPTRLVTELSAVTGVPIE